MVLVLRDQRIFVRAIDDPLPQRPNQADEPTGFNCCPAGGLELPCRSFLLSLFAQNSLRRRPRESGDP
jgi:hypothetical protein